MDHKGTLPAYTNARAAWLLVCNAHLEVLGILDLSWSSLVVPNTFCVYLHVGHIARVGAFTGQRMASSLYAVTLPARSASSLSCSPPPANLIWTLLHILHRYSVATSSCEITFEVETFANPKPAQNSSNTLNLMRLVNHSGLVLFCFLFSNQWQSRDSLNEAIIQKISVTG